MNGFTKENDPMMKTSVRDPRYPEAYYPYYNPELHTTEIPKPRDFSIPMNRYVQGIYKIDQKPYYGPPESYRTFFEPELTTNRVN